MLFWPHVTSSSDLRTGHPTGTDHALKLKPQGVYTRRMIRTNVHLTERQLKALRVISERTGLSVAEIIRRAVDAMLERGKKERGKNAGRP